MKTLLTTKLGRLKLIATLEGISFLVLIGIAMPLKYIWHQPWLTQNTGLAHGIFFILYLLAIIQSKIELQWAAGKTILAMILSLVPFGTFYVVGRMIPKFSEPENDLK